MAGDVTERTRKARVLAQTRSLGVLTTNLSRAPGYPFGSLVNYIIDSLGRPVMLLSGLAVHTGNLSADPKASLFVFAAEAETATMSAARLNLAGNTAQVSDEDAAPLRALYLQRHPDAEQYIDFGDFA